MKLLSAELGRSMSLSLNDDAKVQHRRGEIKRIHWRSPSVYCPFTARSLTSLSYGIGLMNQDS